MACCVFMTKHYINKQCTINVDKMLAEGRLQETENGYVEVLTTTSTVEDKNIRKHRVNGRKIADTYYDIIFFNKELNKKQSVDVGNAAYDEFEIGDKILLTRYVYYTKGGVRTWSEDELEVIE